MEQEKKDEIWMQRALQLANYGAGHVSPNPMVGAVIVSDEGKLIGQGWHRRYGGPHAEVNAFASVKPEDEHLISRSTIYVTLEPCSHYGKTPPCAKLLIDKGIHRCVVGCGDPNPKVAGRGIKMLRDAGIEITENVLQKECYHLNRRFMTAQIKHRPWILLKWAQTADGFIAALNKSGTVSKNVNEITPATLPIQISTPLSAIFMHRERSLTDAILVGTNTLLADNPTLSTRLWPGNSPRPVIFSSPKINDKLQVMHRNPILLDPTLPLANNLNLLFSEYGVTSLMVEGGQKLLQSFIDADLYDEIRIETSNFRTGDGLRAPDICHIKY